MLNLILSNRPAGAIFDLWRSGGGFGYRGFRRGASLFLTQKRDEPEALKLREPLLTWLTNDLTLYSAELRRFHGRGQAQAPLLRGEQDTYGQIRYKRICA